MKILANIEKKLATVGILKLSFGPVWFCAIKPIVLISTAVMWLYPSLDVFTGYTHKNCQKGK
jgi:hypothetical protein